MVKVKRHLILNLGVVSALVAILSLSLAVKTGAASGKGEVKAFSHEIVACDQNPDGTVEAIRIVDWISLSGNGTVTLEKRNDLGGEPKFTGMSGFTAPVLEGNHIVWKNLEVSGDSNLVASSVLPEALREELRTRIPVEFKYRYFLDGKEARLEDITGKSGHFRMELTMRNTSKEKSEEVEVYLLLVISPYDWYFDNRTFFNLRCDPTGLIMYMPNDYTVGWSIPLFPPATDDTHTIWVEADVKNLSMKPLTLAVAFVFPGTNQRDTLSETASGLEMLYGGVKQLDAGLRQGVSGLGSATTPDTLIYGITQVYGGLTQLADGLKEAVDPLTGLPAAKTGLDSQLIPGIDQIYFGIGSPTTENTLLYVASEIRKGLMSGSMTKPGLFEGIAALKEGIVDQMIPGLNELIFALSGHSPDPSNPTLMDGLMELKRQFTVDDWHGIPTPEDPCTIYAFNNHMPLNPWGGVFNQYFAEMAAGIQQMIDGINNEAVTGIKYFQYILSGHSPDPSNPTVMDALNMMQYNIYHYGEGESDPTLNFAIGAIIDNLTKIKYGLISGSMSNPGIKEGLLQISSGLGEAVAGLGQAVAGLGGPTIANTLLFGADQINNGLNQLKAGLIQATDQGTGVMLSALYENLTTLNLTFGELEAIKQRGEEFSSVLGPLSEGEQDLRFAFQTKPTHNYSEGGGLSMVTALIISLLLIVGLVGVGIFAMRKL